MDAGVLGMSDAIENICGATVQHGRDNHRIYLMKIGEAEPGKLILRLDELAGVHGYSKIFAKVPIAFEPAFLCAGYVREAAIPRFYRGSEDAVFLCRYPEPRRAVLKNAGELDAVLALARARRGLGVRQPLSAGAAVRLCGERDVNAMAGIYRQVFSSYPFPVHEPAYLLSTMRSHVLYFGIEEGGRLVALASAEMDVQGRNAEMTDFATMPESLGRGFAAVLLSAMEPEMAGRGITTLYTIARAVSPGMNITFARLGYAYGGRLVNNTQISGAIESMHVWYRHLK